MDIRNNNVNLSSNGIKSYNNKLKSNKNMSFAGVSAKTFPMQPEIKTDEVKKAVDVMQKGVTTAVKEFSGIHANQELSEKSAPLFLRMYAKYFEHIVSPITEKYYTKPHVKDANEVKKLRTCESIPNLVGNSAKELTCMIFYPLMTLTNQDMSTDKKRFVGIYDFFVTCFSLSGSLFFALAKKQTDYLPVKQIAKYERRGFSGLSNAQKGAAFVFNTALQTLLCKRILAPALSPPLAAGVRKRMEKNDAKKAEKEGKVAPPNVAADNKSEKLAIKPQDMPAAKAVEKPAAAKAIEKPAEKVAERPAAKAEEKPAVKTADKPAAKTIEKPADKVAEKPAAKTVEKPADKTTDKAADKKQPEQNLFAVYNKQTKKTEKTA